MTQLNEEQLAAVTRWAEEGATLNEIQNKLKESFGITITYMEARLLAVESGIKIQDKIRQEAVANSSTTTDIKSAEDEDLDEMEGELDGMESGGDGREFANQDSSEVGKASFFMEPDELTVPGMLVSGTVVFSDGAKAKWYLDQMGRLTLKADKTGYQPPSSDIPKFQKGLQAILVKRGL